MKKWYKGNLHCHTTNSDGKSAPEEVAAYYKEIGLDFIGISDHNILTELQEYGDIFDENFIGIPCCEFSGAQNCHVLAINPNKAVKPTDRDTGNWAKEKILQDGINKTIKAKGIPVLCHPSWLWTYTEKEIKKTKKCSFLEICNAAPDCNSYPIPGYSANDIIWDKLLSSGLRYKGIATDDAHFYKMNYYPRMSLGGRGWIWVKSSKLSKKHILDAIIEGHFYASTGIKIKKYSVSKDKIQIAIETKSQEVASFEFIGNKSKILQHTIGKNSEYQIKENENYIRIRIGSTAIMWTWTQPIFLH